MDSRTLLLKTDAQPKQASGTVAFLGPWCRDAHQPSALPRVLPNHFSSFARVDQLHAISDALFDRYLARFAERLSEIHGITWSLRAWAILIGPWLSMVLDALVDRYEALRHAASSPDLYTYATTYPDGAWIPADMLEFSQLIGHSDHFNEYLFSRILVESTETRGLAQGSAQAKDWPARIPFPRTAKRAVKSVLRAFCPRLSNRITFVDSYFETSDLLALERKLGQIPNFLLPDIRLAIDKMDGITRGRLNLAPQATDDLDATLSRVLPDILPKAYLEGFAEYHESASRSFPRRTELIVTAHAYSYNEGFRFWAASQINQGAKLVSVQHGGGFGIQYRNDALVHECRVVDHYCTSGWTSEQATCTVPMPIPKLAAAKRSLAWSREGSVLWIWMLMLPYPNNLTVRTIKEDTAEYLESQLRFGHALDFAVRQRVTTRLYPLGNHWGKPNRESVWGEHSLVRREFPEMLADDGKFSLEAAVKNSRLLVITYNSTILLEAMVANIPFVMFWNPDHAANRLSDEAIPVFEELRKCGVLHLSPESAAKLVNERFADVEGWWMGAEIQRARSEFCRKFAITQDNWLDAWAMKLEEFIR